VSELDELRRVAYGRTSNAAEEAAAEEARSLLARHEASEQRERAARAADDADEFARARASQREPGLGEAVPSEPVAAVEPADEPGYLRRVAGSWRVWVVPALAAFVVGVVLTAASVILVLNTNDEADTAGQRVLNGSELLDPNAVSPYTVDPGDIAAATALFAAAQQPDDLTEVLDPDIDTASTRRVHSTLYEVVFAAKKSDGHLCLLLVKPNGGPSSTSCVNESTFVAQGLSVIATRGASSVRISWDGVTATDSAAK
jgi:hypothetical protein